MLKRFGTLLSVSLKLLSLLSAVLPLRTLLIYKDMRRITTADKVSVGFQYLNDENKEVGNIRYNLVEGYFSIAVCPPSFSALRKIEEYLKLLSFALKIVKSEKCKI